MTQQPHILYIEDNRDNQRLVQRILGARGYTVMIAPDGMTALALARETLPVLILVDINIPGLDGYETTTRLKSMAHLHETPVVALTADVSPGARERALVAGCDGYLSKPIDPRQLPEQVLAFISGKREFVPPGVETPMLRAYNQKVVERLEQRVRELMQAHNELQEIDRLKNRFLSSLSHELRTPLTSLLGYIDLLNRGMFGDLNELQQEALEVLQRNGDLLNRQLNNLIYLQEYRSLPLALVAVDLTEMARRLVQELQPKVERSGVQLILQADSEICFDADRVALELALTNVLDNALKFTSTGGSINLMLHNEPSRVIIVISDTGIGIPPEALDKIFIPFYRIDHPTVSSQPGNGIGLALVQHIVEAHGGQITVRSTPAKGSTFTVTLPKHQDTQPDQAATV